MAITADLGTLQRLPRIVGDGVSLLLQSRVRTLATGRLAMNMCGWIRRPCCHRHCARTGTDGAGDRWCRGKSYRSGVLPHLRALVSSWRASWLVCSLLCHQMALSIVSFCPSLYYHALRGSLRVLPLDQGERVLCYGGGDDGGRAFNRSSHRRQVPAGRGRRQGFTSVQQAHKCPQQPVPM